MTPSDASLLRALAALPEGTRAELLDALVFEGDVAFQEHDSFALDTLNAASQALRAFFREHPADIVETRGEEP